MFCVVVIVFIGLMFLVWLWLPLNMHIDTSSPPSNGTIQISVQTVPTVINGVTTVTSIVVGFSATLVGIVAHEILGHDERDERVRKYMIGGILFLFPSILLLDFGAYLNLLVGGASGFMTAIIYVLDGFLLALLVLVGIFISIWLINEEHGIGRAINQTPKQS